MIFSFVIIIITFVFFHLYSLASFFGDANPESAETIWSRQRGVAVVSGVFVIWGLWLFDNANSVNAMMVGGVTFVDLALLTLLRRDIIANFEE